MAKNNSGFAEVDPEFVKGQHQLASSATSSRITEIPEVGKTAEKPLMTLKEALSMKDEDPLYSEARSIVETDCFMRQHINRPAKPLKSFMVNGDRDNIVHARDKKEALAKHNDLIRKWDKPFGQKVREVNVEQDEKLTLEELHQQMNEFALT